MLLSKEVAVELNLTHCKLKLFMAAMLKANNIDLTPEQFLLVDLLWNQGDLSQQQLADRMQKDKNSITKLIDAIEQKGFVVREQNPADRRSNTIVLTEKGHNLKLEAKKVGIGFEVDDAQINTELKDRLYSWYHSLDFSAMDTGCKAYLEQALKENREFEALLLKHLQP